MKKLLISFVAVGILFATNNTATKSHIEIKKQHTFHHKFETFNFNIIFKSGSATLQKKYIPKIKTFADYLKKHPKYKATIIGFTDNKGNKKYNLKLSEKRAKIVYQELIKLGIDKKRLSYKGESGTHPIASNKTAKGRMKNRRVIAVIIK
ncbi:OmpA family protein [Nautilia lithotrophica]